ncbi:unnamed protein product [Toxocara canis]|uniref:Glycosyltransferase family 92 protein n=1 Tax=Toxocara canis TaxID=6265 RepID=A0A183TZS8_TOXCA|nr:unnamed protein product [Toxocara canis]
MYPIDLELLEDCPPGWISHCTYSGQYGNAKIPTRLTEEILTGNKTLRISYADETSFSHPLRLIDSRTSTGRKPTHKLAVCAYPVVQMTDWTQLVRFMESWIAHGATKFFIVFQSSSTEFDAMLRIYENDERIDVERVHWGVLPTAANISLEEDPNGNVNRAEVR